MELARQDAQLGRCKWRLPVHLNAPKRYRLETARHWLTQESDTLTLWCAWAGISPHYVIRRSRTLVADALAREHAARAQVVFARGPAGGFGRPIAPDRGAQ